MEQQIEPKTRLLRANEVAEALGVRTAFVYALARRQAIPVVRVGRYFRFDPEAIARWKEAGGNSATSTVASPSPKVIHRRPRRIR
jgi:excisionase family DNA binding protein